MKIGDRVHNTVWVTGDEHPEMRALYEHDVKEAITYMCHSHGFEHGDFTLTEHLPDTDLSTYIKDTTVPDHIQGSRVRLLVIEADVTGKKLQTTEGSFINNLERADLARLRKITRDAFVKKYKYFPPQGEIDDYIEQLGPDAAIDVLRNS